MAQNTSTPTAFLLCSFLTAAALLLAAASLTTAIAAVASTANTSAGVPSRAMDVGAEWVADLEEWQLPSFMESESSRRMLATAGYITYPTLGRQSCNNPPNTPYTHGNGCLSQALNSGGNRCSGIYYCKQNQHK